MKKFQSSRPLINPDQFRARQFGINAGVPLAETADPHHADQVRAHLSLFTAGFPAAAEVAAALGFSERTLRHQLRNQGTSFRRILEELRFARARQLLEGSQLPVEAIAGQLGYAESAAFIHAFQRWSGCTPALYRRQQQGRLRSLATD